MTMLNPTLNKEVEEFVRKKSPDYFEGPFFKVADFPEGKNDIEIAKRLICKGVSDYSLSFNPLDLSIIVHNMVPEEGYDKKEIIEKLLDLTDRLSILAENYAGQDEQSTIFFKGITRTENGFKEGHTLKHLQYLLIDKRFNHIRSDNTRSIAYNPSGALYSKHPLQQKK